MKKNILILAVAVLVLGMTSCQKENNVEPNNNTGVVVDNPRVKSTADLIGTDWIYTMNNMMALDENGDTIIIPMDLLTIDLNFDTNYAHFTFGDDVEIWSLSANDLTMQQLQSIDFAYDYTYATHTGHLNGYAEDDNGNTVPSQLEFTYDDVNDDITFMLQFAFYGDTSVVSYPVVFHRN